MHFSWRVKIEMIIDKKKITNVVFNCKAERDDTNANKHDTCICILKQSLSNKFVCNLHLQILASLLVV